MDTDVNAGDSKSSNAERLLLVGGLNFTTWPDLKWSRAKSHLAILESKFDEWQASAPVSIEVVLRDDRLGFDLVARVPRGIPKHEWSLDLGDALHNLRSAFDAVAWGMAHFNGAKPTNSRSVQFPICVDQKQWKKALDGWVSELPAELQERLRIMQPFVSSPSGAVWFTTMLHELDIQDKHHDMLTVAGGIQQIDFDGSFELEDPDAPACVRVELNPDVSFRDGAVIGTVHTGAAVRTVGQLIVRPAMKVQLTYRDSAYDVVPFLQELVAETRRALNILLFGLESTDETDDAEWIPVDVGPASSSE